MVSNDAGDVHSSAMISCSHVHWLLCVLLTDDLVKGLCSVVGWL